MISTFSILLTTKSPHQDAGIILKVADTKIPWVPWLQGKVWKSSCDVCVEKCIEIVVFEHIIYTLYVIRHMLPIRTIIYNIIYALFQNVS